MRKETSLDSRKVMELPGTLLVVTTVDSVRGVYTSRTDAHLAAKTVRGRIWLCRANSDGAVEVTEPLVLPDVACHSAETSARGPTDQ